MGSSGWVPLTPSVLTSGKPSRVMIRETAGRRFASQRCIVADFEDGRREPRAKGCRWLLGAEKRRGTGAHTEPPPGAQRCPDA